MKLFLIGHDCKYECEKICRIFFPTEKFEFITDENAPFDGGVYTRAAERTENEYVFFSSVKLDAGADSETLNFPSRGEIDGGEFEKLLAVAMVKCLSRVTGITPPWGILTGVRPSKLMLRYITNYGEAEAVRVFTQKHLVSDEKAALALTVARAEKPYIDLSRENSFSLYVSIPFCPTRCSYCSFVSHSIASAEKLIPDYIRLLCREIEYTAAKARESGMNLETVYIGGGTPTSLDENDLETLLDCLNRNFAASGTREFTVEAGRPDTITREKLRVMKKAGVTRISINPQSFSDDVLKNIGRRHTAADILEKFALARDEGFDRINMDFIAGLPGDTPAGFENSMNVALSLGPENITVHTLALKTSANLVTEKEELTVCRDTAQMTNTAAQKLGAAGYIPYYMYRQSKSVGNLENVGYALPGTECLYNIYMMEEIHTVIAVGGGAVSKLIAPGGALERVYNFKYPYEYISRFDEIIKRKDGCFPSVKG